MSDSPRPAASPGPGGSGPPRLGFADRIGLSAREWPEKLALVDVARGDAGRFTYGELDRRARRTAVWLRAAGVGPGDRVGILARNGIAYIDLFAACGKLGAVFVPFNWRLHPEELEPLAHLTRPAVLVVADEFAPGGEAIARAGARVVALDQHEALTQVPDERAGGGSTDRDPADVDPESIACLLFTGGTSGAAKAARISHRMIGWNTLTTAIHELQRDDVTITHTPMFHTGGLLVYTVPLLTLGGTVVLMDRWEPALMLEQIARERVTMFFCVPSQYAALVETPGFREADLASVRFLTSGGAPLPVGLIERWRAVHPAPFKQGFGMTEFGPGVFSMGPEHAVAKAGSIGRPNAFVEARVVRPEDGRPCAIDETGELLLRGPAGCSGYWEDEASSAAAVDDDGWFHTGDLARVDADGFFFIVDRLKDMFVSGGENVYPIEIEAVLRRHPAVADVAVVGVPDGRWGEVGRAFVVLRATEPGDSTDRHALGDALLEHARSALARYKVPKEIVFVDGLPYSAAGKVLKRELRERRA